MGERLEPRATASRGKREKIIDVVFKTGLWMGIKTREGGLIL